MELGVEVRSVSDRAELGKTVYLVERFVWLAVNNEKTMQTNQFSMKLTRFEDLDCWKEARQLTRQVYEAIEQNSSWKKMCAFVARFRALQVR